MNDDSRRPLVSKPPVYGSGYDATGSTGLSCYIEKNQVFSEL